MRTQFGTMPLRQNSRAEHRLRRGRLSRHRSHRRLLARRRDDAEPRSPDSAKTYLLGDGNARPRAGDVFKNPNLAQGLSRDRQGRPRRLLQGPDRRARSSPFPTRTAGCSARRTSRITPRPGSSRSARPIAATTSGNCRRPARASPSLQMLNILEGYDLKKTGADFAGLLAPVRRGQEAGLRRPGQVLRRPATSPRCPSRELISQAVRRRTPQADRHGQGADRHRAPATRSSARATRSTSAWWTRTAIACR